MLFVRRNVFASPMSHPLEPDPTMPQLDVRKVFVFAAVFALCAIPAIAARRSGTALDEPTHARATTALHGGGAVVPPATPSSPDEDSPCLRPGPQGPTSVTPTHMEPRANTHTLPASAPDHRAEKRERGRAANTPAQVHRPTAQRKGSVRNTPATPGMGLLLRFGTNAGQEISYLVDPMTPAPSALRSGRAPPRAGPPSNSAPASRPREQHFAVSPRIERLALRASDAESQNPPISPHLPCPTSSSALLSHAALAAGAWAETAAEPDRDSHATRMKGRSARLFMPFGGQDT